MRNNSLLLICISLLALSLKADLPINSFGSNEEWDQYLGGYDRNHYSKLTQINLSNAHLLEKAWEYELPDEGQMQTNPLMVNGKVYGVSASVQPFALDPGKGKEIWRFQEKNAHWASTSRGVSYWAKGSDKRILFTAGSYLWALNADTGEPISTFGTNGKIDLHTGLPATAKDKFIISNTPGTVYGDLIIMPVRLSEGEDAAPGDIRAFNIITGALAWTFRTIPYPGEYGYNTFPKNAYKNTEIGAANNWCGMALDPKTGIVYVPTGSAAYDFYGGNRPGSNLFANCLLALNAKTGKRIWHYQFVHHDIWDRDAPSPPNLLTINHKGIKKDIVTINTKNGFVFMFDRYNGKPIHPIKEVAVPKSDIPGEKAWPTQPRPTWPLPFARQSENLTENDISPYAENADELKQRFKKYKKAFYAPPSLEGTVILPGYDGGPEWGGAAVDHQGVMYINSNEMAWINTLKPTATGTNLSKGESAYVNYCQVCHKADKKGDIKSGYPSLINIGAKYKSTELLNLINAGKGMMPGFSYLKIDQKEALITFLFNTEKKEVGSNNETKPKIPFKMDGYNKFLDNRGLPAIKPPWGTLNALDLNTGKYLWNIPLGDEPLLAAEGIKNTGTENYGGPVVTESGLLIIAATKDAKLRIFEAKTGKLISIYDLPAASFATPTTYMYQGKQYIVLACGGTKLGTPKGKSYVAFALK